MTSRRHVLGLVASGLATSLAGCGYRPGGGDIQWRHASVSERRNVKTSGLIRGAYITVTEPLSFYDSFGSVHEGRITAYAIDTGQQVLEASLSNPVERVTIGDDGVVVAADRTVTAYGLDGKRWDLTLGTPVEGVAVGEGHVFALTGDGELIALAGGNERWRRNLRPETTDSEGVGRLVAGDRTALVTVGDRVICFSPDGARRWTAADRSLFQVRVEGGLIFARTTSSTVVLDPGSGETRFRAPMGTKSIAVTDDSVYCLTSGALLAFDRSGGRRWTRTADALAGSDGRPGVGTVDYDDRVAADADGVFVTARDRLFSLVPGDASVRWSVSHDSITGGPFVGEEGVIVVDNGDIVCHHRAE